ncbi:MAG: methyltransferase [Gammaproteobacteria bacterium]|nr:methyltransferase [Gammaproteobacteria bacterium]
MEKKQYIDSLRKDIVFNAELGGFPFTFHSTWGIFSPREIDEGTELLLERINIAKEANCFDLGCGYGPIGLTMARMAPAGQTIMVDKDFMAVEYANKNAEFNGINNAKALLSNGFQHIPQQSYDVIASNIPAKVGKEMLQIIMYDTFHRLSPGGKFYVVTINGLRDFMKRHFKETFGNYDKVKQGKNYTVALAEKSESR